MKSFTTLFLLILLVLPVAQAADGTQEGAVPNLSAGGSIPQTIIRETDDTYAITAFESVSISPTQTWQDNRHRAYYSGSYNVDGYLLFDVTQIPDNAQITGMSLRCTLENAFGSPYLNPVVDVYYSGDDNWTRMTAGPGSLSLDVLLTDNVSFPSYVSYYDFPLNVSAHNWTPDLLDNRICIGFKDDVNYYSYVYFYGAYGSPVGPAPVLTITTGPSVIPNVEILLSPINPPIIIPPQGGSFMFNAGIVNHGPQMPFYAWGGLKFPDGSWVNSLGPLVMNPPVGIVVSRLRQQNVPGTWPPGQYTYIGYAALTYPGVPIDSGYFYFTKLAGEATGPMVWDASCTGELFPGETPVSATGITANGVTDGAGVVPPENPFDVVDTLWWTGSIDQHIFSNQTLSWTTDLPQIQTAKLQIKYGLWNSPNLTLEVYVNNNFVGSVIADQGYISPGPEYATFGVGNYIVAGPDVIEVRAQSGGEAVVGHVGIGYKTPLDALESESFSVNLTPNPFNPTTAISYELRAASYTSLKVYDTAGRLVATLIDGWREAGTHQVTFDGSDLASGLYIYTLQAGGQITTGKMMLVK
jgi:hypothetical protein